MRLILTEIYLWLPTENDEGIKIEVKSSHVAEDEPESILVEKAYKKPRGTDEEISNAIKGLNFKMNFQQLKPSCCDVFIWIAVWLDDIDIWVIPSSKIVMRPENAPRRKPKDSIVSPEGVLYMGTQHQGGKGGDVPEGQIFVTNNHYDDLKQYKVSLDTRECSFPFLPNLCNILFKNNLKIITYMPYFTGVFSVRLPLEKNNSCILYYLQIIL